MFGVIHTAGETMHLLVVRHSGTRGVCAPLVYETLQHVLHSDVRDVFICEAMEDLQRATLHLLLLLKSTSGSVSSFSAASASINRYRHLVVLVLCLGLLLRHLLPPRR